MAFVLGEMAQQGLELIEYEETEGTSTQDAVQTTWGPSPIKRSDAPGEAHADRMAAGGMASSWSLKDFMEKNGITQLGPDNLRDLFKGMSKETIDAFIGAGHKLYHTTVMPNEGILLPFNWVFAEKIHSNNDVLGLRITFWLNDDETDITAASRWLISMKNKIYAPGRVGCVG